MHRIVAVKKLRQVEIKMWTFLLYVRVRVIVMTKGFIGYMYCRCINRKMT